MREPARIDRILDKLRQVWAMDKDARFGQLVYAIFWQMPQTKVVDESWVEQTYVMHKYGIDPFYVEDDIFEAFVDRLIAEKTLVVDNDKV